MKTPWHHRLGTAAQPLALLLPLLSFFLCLGTAPLFDVDEGAFAEATREMFERGDFLSTYLNGANRFDKPILIYWLQALGYLAFGPTEWAFRFPSAVAASLWCYACWLFARPRFDPATAYAALAVAATAIGPVIIGRAATADALLNLLLALTLFDAWRHLESGSQAALLRSFAWMGLGALTKGPVAVLIPALVSLLYCATRGEWRRWAGAAFHPRGWLIFAILVVPWYGAALLIHGRDFIDGFILRHNVERFAGTLEGHSGSLYYYVLIVPLLLLPWTGVLLAALRYLREDWHNALRRFLWLWAALVLVFFSLSGTKLPHYALYGASPLFLLIATHRQILKRDWLHLLPVSGLLLLYLFLPLAMQLVSALEAVNPYYRALLANALAEAGWRYFIPLLLGILLWALIQKRHQWPLWPRLIGGAILQVLLMIAVVQPFAGRVLQGPVKEAGLLARQQAYPVVTWRFTAPSFSVYRRAVTPSRPPESGEAALVRTDRLPDSGYETLYRQGGVALIRALPTTAAAPASPTEPSAGPASP